MPWSFPSFSLASDNVSGAHPKILAALADANTGYAPAYGMDSLTRAVEEQFCSLFGQEVRSFLVMNGTGANVVALSALQKRGSAVVCPASAHINTHETGAPESALGIKLLPTPHTHGKIDESTLSPFAGILDNHHVARPDIVSLSQTTEYGTVYTGSETKRICDRAHQMGMHVHVDGARFANAVVAAKESPKALTADAGVDVLCFGGTKNGMLMGEAIIFFNLDLADRFLYLRKQYLQLCSKGRFLAAQFRAYLQNDLWLSMAAHANDMAALLAGGIEKNPGASLAAPQISNQVFACIPKEWYAPLMEIASFHPQEDGSCRFVTSFDTKEEDIMRFLHAMEALAGA